MSFKRVMSDMVSKMLLLKIRTGKLRLNGLWKYLKLQEQEDISMLRKISYLVVLIILISSQSSFAALNAYLEVIGETQGLIKGSVTQAGREDMIMVIGFDHIISSSRDSETCFPARTNHQPIQITKEIDKSTPLLFAAFATNEILTEFRLRFWQPSNTGQEFQFYTIELVNARIVGIHQEMLNNKYPENMQHKEREYISFAYDKITVTFEDGGITGEDDWQTNCGTQLRISDLNFDGVVNLLDVSIMAKEWLLESY